MLTNIALLECFVFCIVTSCRFYSYFQVSWSYGHKHNNKNVKQALVLYISQLQLQLQLQHKSLYCLRPNNTNCTFMYVIAEIVHGRIYNLLTEKLPVYDQDLHSIA